MFPGIQITTNSRDSRGPWCGSLAAITGRAASLFPQPGLLVEMVITLANLVIQIGLIDRFLGGMFTIYGPMVFEISSQDPEDRDDPMNLVFPKVRHISWTCQTNKGRSC